MDLEHYARSIKQYLCSLHYFFQNKAISNGVASLYVSCKWCTLADFPRKQVKAK
jgi:hypothetical protein